MNLINSKKNLYILQPKCGQNYEAGKKNKEAFQVCSINLFIILENLINSMFEK